MLWRSNETETEKTNGLSTYLPSVFREEEGEEVSRKWKFPDIHQIWASDKGRMVRAHWRTCEQSLRWVEEILSAQQHWSDCYDRVARESNLRVWGIGGKGYICVRLSIFPSMAISSFLFSLIFFSHGKLGSSARRTTIWRPLQSQAKGFFLRMLSSRWLHME